MQRKQCIELRDKQLVLGKLLRERESGLWEFISSSTRFLRSEIPEQANKGSGREIKSQY